MNDMIKAVYFTDAHNQPTLNQDRFIWLANMVNEESPDYLIDGGDFDDFHSLCSHEKNETEKGRVKPALLTDLECSAKARGLISDALIHNPKKVVTLGNHEARIFLYENNNREVQGLASNHYFDILEKNGWDYFDYGEKFECHGVDFTHCPFTGMGKPFGGDLIAKNVSAKSRRDIVFGHTHQLTTHTDHKTFNESVTAYNLGCYMPDLYVPNYVKNTRKEFWYGAHILMICGGKVKSVKSFHMSEMEYRYSKNKKTMFVGKKVIDR